MSFSILVKFYAFCYDFTLNKTPSVPPHRQLSAVGFKLPGLHARRSCTPGMRRKPRNAGASDEEEDQRVPSFTSDTSQNMNLSASVGSIPGNFDIIFLPLRIEDLEVQLAVDNSITVVYVVRTCGNAYFATAPVSAAVANMASQHPKS